MKKMAFDLRLWRWQRYTALAVFPLVLAHVFLQYFVFGADAATFANVSARIQGGAVLALDVVLLAAVASHAFLGLRSMLQDYARTSTAAAWITRSTLLAVAGVFVYGVIVLVAFL